MVTWAVFHIYPRVASARYGDGLGELVDAPAARYLSNRIFNDVNQNVFSENGITHWGFVWGQFIDHTIGLRETSEAEDLLIAFDPEDPLEAFANDLGGIHTTRTAAAAGTGIDMPREQVNTISSFIDAWAVYGGTAERLDWLRDGVVDGDPTNNAATLLNVDGYLPTAAARPDTDAPATELMGALFGKPASAVIAGDMRANENIGLTAVQTLFLREHNRIVELLPVDLDAETKFQIPGPDTENPLDCLDGDAIADCFSGVNDLGVLDVMRAYDHGMPTYNELRVAYGLPAVSSFADLTGEATDDFPDDPAIDGADPIDDPGILDFVFLADRDGNELALDSPEAETDAVTAVRRTTTAARLKAIFGDVDSVDAFTGMVSEPHVAGTEFGELQLAMWTAQFQALRDGDRFFYGNDLVLAEIADAYGVDFRRTLAEVIVANTDIDADEVPANVFVLADQPVETAVASAAQDGAGAPRVSTASATADPDDAVAAPGAAAVSTVADDETPPQPRQPRRSTADDRPPVADRRAPSDLPARKPRNTGTPDRTSM